MDEAEQIVRKQMQNRKGVETFIVSARIATYNKLFGLDPASAYRSPVIGPPPEKQEPESADGAIDLTRFNKKDESK